MKKYYIVIKEEKHGPFSVDELKSELILPDTLVWTTNFKNWKKASEVSELTEILKKSPPSIPSKNANVESRIPMPLNDSIPLSNENDGTNKTTDLEIGSKHKYGYDTVEDTAGVDYKKAYILTASYIMSHFLGLKNGFFLTLSILLILLGPIFIWRYFKLYFKSLGDVLTGKFVNYIIYSHITLIISYIIMHFLQSRDSINASIGELFDESLKMLFDSDYIPKFPETEQYLILALIFVISIFTSLISLWYGGIKLLKKNKVYEIPLRGIALSVMICMPINICIFLSELGLFEAAIGWRIIILIPYIFLFVHFLKADLYDKTLQN